MTWEVERAEYCSHRLHALLAAGWKPFGAGDSVVWVRRRITALQPVQTPERPRLTEQQRVALTGAS